MLLSHTTALSREKFGLDGNIYIRKPAPTQIYRGYRVWNFARISFNGFVLHGWSRRHWTLLAGNYKVRRRGRLIQSRSIGPWLAIEPRYLKTNTVREGLKVMQIFWIRIECGNFPELGPRNHEYARWDEKL